MFAQPRTLIKRARGSADTSGMNGSERVTPGAREAAFHRALTDHPAAAVAAMDDDGLITAIPADLPVTGCVVIEGRWLVEMVVPSDRVAIAAAWETVRSLGMKQLPVEFRNGIRADVYWFDLRERYGVYVAVVASSDATFTDFASLSEIDEVAPRYGIAYRNVAGNIIACDAAVSRLLGYSVEELVEAQTIDFIHPDDHERAIENWLETLAKPNADTRWRGRHRRADGEYIWLEFTNCNLLDDPEYAGVRSEMLDISDEMAMHDALRNSEARFRRLAESLPLGLAQIDADRQIVYANRPFSDIVGLAEPSVGAAFARTPPDDRRRLDHAIDAALERNTDARVEITLRRPAEAPRVIDVFVRRLEEQSNGASSAIVVVADVTDHTAMRNELERRANFDALTRCYNRSTILSLLEARLAGATSAAQGTAAIFVDLDRFKPVNDRFGHATGDEVLKIVADRLRVAVRDHDLVGRLGGDEFLVICPNIDDSAVAIDIAERIAESLQADFVIHRDSVSLCASVGVAWAAGNEVDADTLVSRADAAMYRSKRAAAGSPVVDESVPNPAA
jgi:diguanylate cyclase (GGDEF)-like protein/PAS domain S-box-containing protein